VASLPTPLTSNRLLEIINHQDEILQRAKCKRIEEAAKAREAAERKEAKKKKKEKEGDVKKFKPV